MPKGGHYACLSSSDPIIFKELTSAHNAVVLANGGSLGLVGTCTKINVGLWNGRDLGQVFFAVYVG